MNKLYRKSEIWFSVLWIIFYVVGTSTADIISEKIGVQKSVSAVYLIVLSAVAVIWLAKNRLFKEYGLCRPTQKASRFLYYIPLILLCTCNFWYGVRLNLSVHETVLYILSMICVGFLEELIFRGFLFKAMAKNGIKSAIIVSSLTFGVGHIVNLINGSGADLLSNICQVCYAITFGFMCVIIFYKGGSLLPCIIAHSTINSLSVFVNEANQTTQSQITVSAILFFGALIYALILLKTLSKPTA